MSPHRSAVHAEVSTKELLAVYGGAWTATLLILGPVHVFRRRGRRAATMHGLIVFGAFVACCYLAAALL